MPWQSFFSEFLRQLLVPVIDGVTVLLLQTPHVETDPTVARLWGVCLGIAGGCLGIAVVWLGVSTMVRGAFPELHGWDRAAPRLAVALVQLAASPFVLGRLIDLSNAVALALVMDGGADALKSSAGLAQPGASPAVMLLLTLVGIASILLAVVQIVRVILLAAAAAVGPLAQLAYAVPQFEGFCLGWWRLVLVCLSVPVVDAVLLSLSISLVSSEPHGLLRFPDLGQMEQTVALLAVVVALIAVPVLLATRIVLPSRRSLGGALIGAVTR